MARLKLTAPRKTDIKSTYLGKALVFCEGCTEKNYLKYFAKIIEQSNNKHSSLEVVPVNAKGNAQTVLNFANKYLANEENSRNFLHYSKFLVFDCDAPPDIQAVIVQMKKNVDYQPLPTNLLFETWLLMHFEEVDTPMLKSKTYERMAEKLEVEYYNDKEKAKFGNIAKIIGDGSSVYLAIENAKRLHDKYEAASLDIEHNILEMNPCAEIYTLIEDILQELQKL